MAGLRVIGVDVTTQSLSSARDLVGVCADSQKLPFEKDSFDLIICHHSMEHFSNPNAAIHEIRRVLKSSGRLFLSVPDGSSFSDRLYRLLLCGGGHFQRFSFGGMVALVETAGGLKLAGSRELFSSFIFVERSTFIPAPLGKLPGPLPRRMRWLGHLPAGCFESARFTLNLVSRMVDRISGTSLARYGWAFAFSPDAFSCEVERAAPNVCMSCGAGLERADVTSTFRFFYRCPKCSDMNILFSR